MYVAADLVDGSLCPAELGLLVVAVLLLLLGNLRGGLIVAIAIPLSMLFAFTGMLMAGLSGNLMSPGADVQRVSYRNEKEQQLLSPGEVVAVTIDGLLTANRFDVGHRIRIQVSASFSPHLSRYLQTGLSETISSKSVPATIVVHHGGEYVSSLELPLID